MQRLIVLSYVLAGTNVSSADRLVTVLEPKALIRAPTMRSAKLDRRSANREVPWTLEAPVLAIAVTVGEHVVVYKNVFGGYVLFGVRHVPTP